MRSAHLTLTAARCALLLFPTVGYATPSIPSDAVIAWRSLLYYEPVGTGWVSSVPDASFFLDSSGRRDPAHEWFASYREFLARDTLDAGLHARCRFPARFQLMKTALKWTDEELPTVECAEYAKHEANVRATSLAVVFVSDYLGNPASAFGHTMLYFGSTSSLSQLSSYSVSFEADTEGMSATQYLPRGLFGGLAATYKIEPLYRRVRRYEREEQRDLWLFPLKVTQQETDQLVRHLWELRNISFAYGFFGGNCAQKLLSLVHAVAPRYEILPFQKAAVLPSEVAKRLVSRIGLAGEPVRRPSLRNQYSSLVLGLNRDERRQLQQMVSSRTVHANASASALTAALLWSEMKTPFRSFRREGEDSAHPDFLWKRSLWASRVDAGAQEPQPTTSSIDRSPSSLLQAHRTSMVAVRTGIVRTGAPVFGIQGRWLLHGAIDPQQGYPDASTVEVANLKVESNGEGTLLVDEATAIRVESLGSAVDGAHVNWRLEIGARRLPRGGSAPLHFGTDFALGAGARITQSSSTLTAYSLAGLRLGAVVIDGRLTFAPVGSFSSGFLLHFPGDVRSRTTIEYSLPLNLLRDGGLEFRSTTRKGLRTNLDLEVSITVNRDRPRGTLGFVAFR